MWGCSLSGPACGIMWKFYSLDILFHQHERLCIWWPGFQARHCIMPFGCSTLTHMLYVLNFNTIFTFPDNLIIFKLLEIKSISLSSFAYLYQFSGLQVLTVCHVFFHMVTQLHQNLWSLLNWRVDFVYHPSHWLIGKVALNLEAEVQSCVMLTAQNYDLIFELEHS